MSGVIINKAGLYITFAVTLIIQIFLFVSATSLDDVFINIVRGLVIINLFFIIQLLKLASTKYIYNATALKAKNFFIRSIYMLLGSFMSLWLSFVIFGFTENDFINVTGGISIIILFFAHEFYLLKGAIETKQFFFESMSHDNA